MEFPQEFIDYVQNEYGLECVDFQNEQCYQEWCEVNHQELENYDYGDKRI